MRGGACAGAPLAGSVVFLFWGGWKRRGGVVWWGGRVCNRRPCFARVSFLLRHLLPSGAPLRVCGRVGVYVRKETLGKEISHNPQNRAETMGEKQDRRFLRGVCPASRHAWPFPLTHAPPRRASPVSRLKTSWSDKEKNGDEFFDASNLASSIQKSKSLLSSLRASRPRAGPAPGCPPTGTPPGSPGSSGRHPSRRTGWPAQPPAPCRPFPWPP
jgi:hypothetical protein